MSIRLAQAHDIDAIIMLSHQLGYDTEAETCLNHIHYMLDRPEDYQVLVIEKNMEVAGFMQLSVIRHIHTTSYVEISALSVDSRHRRDGLGSRLVAAAKAWTQEMGYPRLAVRTNELRESATDFYIRAGFRNIKTQKLFQINF